MGSINSNGDGAMFGDGDFQSVYTAWSDVHVTRDLGCRRCVTYMTISVLKGKIRISAIGRYIQGWILMDEPAFYRMRQITD